jgi:hypothetical protein
MRTDRKQPFQTFTQSRPNPTRRWWPSGTGWSKSLDAVREPKFHLARESHLRKSGGNFSHAGILIFTTQQKLACLARGRSTRAFAMTSKVITFEFVVPTVVAIVLGVLLSIGAVYLTEHYFASVVDWLI